MELSRRVVLTCVHPEPGMSGPSLEADLREAIARYLSVFPEAAGRADAMLRFASRHEGEALFDRRNPEGHFTVSAVVCDADAGRVLLLHHKTLGKWLQPGGHAEPGDHTLLAAAVREVEEETGFVRGQYDVIMPPDLQENLTDRPLLFDLDSHAIPDNSSRGEGPHFHHDLRFLFRLRDSGAVPHAVENESQKFRWLSVYALPRLFARPDMVSLLNRFLG